MGFQKGSNRLRRGRKTISGQPYLITTSVENRQQLLSIRAAARIVLDSVLWLEERARIELYAAVVMPDHVHIILSPNKDTLAKAVHSFKSYTAQQINRLLNRRGRFWQSQYHDHAVRKDEDLIQLITYCLNNPVRKGIVNDFHDYPYWYCKFQV